MITYSTNMMGPYSLDWYRERGLMIKTTKVVETPLMAELLKKPIGTSYEVEEVTKSYACGRIDVYGLDEKEYYGGMSEIAVPPMHIDDWYDFSDWLDEFSTDTPCTLVELVEEYEQENSKIRWEKCPVLSVD